jgi:hypothetical protein
MRSPSKNFLFVRCLEDLKIFEKVWIFWNGKVWGAEEIWRDLF